MNTQEAQPTESGPWRIVGGLLSLVLGVLVLIGAIGVAFAAFWLSLLTVGSLGGTLEAKLAMLAVYFVATLLVVALGLFLVVLGIRQLRNKAR